MPDENRSDALPFSERNEPQLQRAVLELLLGMLPERISFYRLVEYEHLRKCDRMALLSAARSLHIGLLVVVDGRGDLIACATAEHFHWLMTEVEPLNG